MNDTRQLVIALFEALGSIPRTEAVNRAWSEKGEAVVTLLDEVIDARAKAKIHECVLVGALDERAL